MHNLGINNPLGLLEGHQDVVNDTRSVGISYTYTITPNLLEEARFGYNHQLYSLRYPQFPNGVALIHQLGLNLSGPFQPGSAIPGFYFLQSSMTGTFGNRQEDRRQHKFQFADNVTWVRGHHTMKMGTDIRANQVADYVSFTGADNFGNFLFDGSFTGFDVADFMLGVPVQSQLAYAGPGFDAHERAYGVYWQDQFSALPRLTITYGLRYEVHPPFFDQDLNIANFNPANGDVVVPNEASLKLAAPGFLASINACPGFPGATTPCTPVITAQQAGIPEGLRWTDYTKVLPRLGFAYRPSDRWVVRGGAGMYDMTLLGNVFYNGVGIHTSDVRFYQNSFTSNTPAFQFPNVQVAGIGSVGAPGTASFYTGTAFHLHDPYAAQWTLSVERQLTNNTGLRVSYTGMRTIGLLLNEDLNQVAPHPGSYNPAAVAFPNWFEVYEGVNGGVSFYNGLETVLTHRTGRGLTFQSSWVWSKNLSDGDGSAAFTNNDSALENGPFIMNPYNLRGDYGNVNFTRRHRWLNTYVYEIPFGRGKTYGNDLNPVFNAIFGNWQTSGILLFQTGPFLTPYYYGGTDPSGTNANNLYPGQRPDRICSGTVANPTAAHYFNSACFPIPPSDIGRFGNSGVGILTGPGTFVWSAGIAKIFPLKENLHIRFEGTATNILNHANLGIPDMNAASSDFGVIHSVQPAEQAGARTLQLGLRMEF